MATFALDVSRRLITQVAEIEVVAARAETDRYPAAAPVVRRAAYVLAVAAIDTYFHEQAVKLLVTAGKGNPSDVTRVANYVQKISATTITGPAAESYIRLRLSYKTLVGPKSITNLLTAAGREADDVWHSVSYAMGSRPDRVQLQLQLFYDRRNQIAHEGDWDFVQLDFRRMEQTHLADVVSFAISLTEAMDAIL